MGVKYPLRSRSLDTTPGKAVDSSGCSFWLDRFLKFGMAIFILWIDGALISMNILPNPGPGKKSWRRNRPQSDQKVGLTFQFLEIEFDLKFFIAFLVSFGKGRQRI